MTLAQLINRIKFVALTQPTIKMVVDNDVFRLNAIPDAKYGVFAYVQGNHRTGEDEDVFRFTFFYVDRLVEDGSNEVEVQSVGKSTLDNIMRTLEDEMGVDEWEITTFNQRFNDMCAGAFCTAVLSVPSDYTCEEVFLPEIIMPR